MATRYILSDYVHQAMAQAVYDKLEDNTFVGRIPCCPGVIAFGATLMECEEQLRSTLEDWIWLGLKLGHRLPVIGRIDLNKEPVLRRNPNTLRSYLPDVRERFVEFFGYDPSKRASESFNRVAGENAPEVGGMDDEGTEGSEEGFTDDTGSAGGKHPATKWRCNVRAVLMEPRILIACLLLMICQSGLPHQYSDDPWENTPLLFSYLMRTEVSQPRSSIGELYECDRQEMYQFLGLSDAEINEMNLIAKREYEAFLQLKHAQMYGNFAPSAIPDCLPTAEPVEPIVPLSQLAGLDWDIAVSIIHQATDEHLRELLGARYPLFREWICKWFPRHIEDLKKQLYSDFQPQADAFMVYVYATQYIPEDRCNREVALPDKYVKFANRARDNRAWCNQIPAGYRRFFSTPHSLQKQETTFLVPLYQPVEMEAIFLDYSPSAWIIHCELLRVKRPQPNSPEESLSQKVIRVDLGQLISIGFDSDEDAKVIAPDGKPISCRKLLPGMLLRLRGAFSSVECFSAEEIRLVNPKIHLKRASLRGQIIERDQLWAHLLTADQKVYFLLSQWPGVMELSGIDPQQFEEKGFLVLDVGDEVQVRGWYLDEAVLVESLRLVKRAKSQRGGLGH